MEKKNQSEREKERPVQGWLVEKKKTKWKSKRWEGQRKIPFFLPVLSFWFEIRGFFMDSQTLSPTKLVSIKILMRK